jgi:hypothetical protein
MLHPVLTLPEDMAVQDKVLAERKAQMVWDLAHTAVAVIRITLLLAKRVWGY